MDDMARVLMAAGWALLLGNLVFQALKSMAAGHDDVLGHCPHIVSGGIGGGHAGEGQSRA